MSAVAEKIAAYYNDPVNLAALTEKQDLFLAGLRETGIVMRACERANVSRVTAYQWRSLFPEFKQRWDDALEDPVDEVEETLLKMAKSGNNITATMSYLRHNRAKYREETRIVVAKEDVDSAIEAALAEHQLPGLDALALETTATVTDANDSSDSGLQLAEAVAVEVDHNE